MNFPRPLILVLRAELLNKDMVVNGSSVLLILYSSVTPCEKPADGNFQEAKTLVEEKGESLKLRGD